MALTIAWGRCICPDLARVTKNSDNMVSKTEPVAIEVGRCPLPGGNDQIVGHVADAEETSHQLRSLSRFRGRGRPHIDPGGEFDVRRMFPAEPCRIDLDGGPFGLGLVLLPHAMTGKVANSPPVSTIVLPRACSMKQRRNGDGGPCVTNLCNGENGEIR